MNDKVFKFADFILDPKQRKFFDAGDNIHLSSRAFEILLLLVQQQGEVVEKETLLKKVWSDSFVEEGNLAVHIYALRRLLGEKRGENKFIETVSGRGYSFVFPVREIAANGENEITELVRTKILASENISPATSVSLAVLPFTTKNENADYEYLAIGLTQSLIDHLSQIPKLTVMAYSAVAHYQKPDLDLPETGFLLGVDKLLVGRISEYQDNLEISVELINVADKRHLWGTQYNCRFTDIFQIKKDISLAIAEKLEFRLKTADAANITKEQTSSSDAYRLYLKGKHILDNYQSGKDYEQSLNSALRFFQQAIKEDPNFALAYVGVARIYHNLSIYNLLGRREAYEKSQNYLQRALKLDKGLSDAYVSNGIIQMILPLDLAEAEKSFQHAIELNPNNARAYHFYSITSVCLGKFETALSYQNKALEFDPTSAVFNCGLAERLFNVGKTSEAIVQAEETLELHNSSMHAFFVLARAFARLGMYEEAFKNARKAMDIHPSEEITLLQAEIHALAGNRKEAQSVLHYVLKHVDGKLVDFTDVARVYAALGEKDAAFNYLEKAAAEGGESISHLKIDSSFINLHPDPRFDVLLQKLKLK